MRHTARNLVRKADLIESLPFPACNEDDWIFQQPRKWFRRMMRLRANRRRPILKEGAKKTQRWHTLNPAESRQLIHHD